MLAKAKDLKLMIHTNWRKLTSEERIVKHKIKERGQLKRRGKHFIKKKWFHAIYKHITWFAESWDTVLYYFFLSSPYRIQEEFFRQWKHELKKRTEDTSNNNWRRSARNESLFPFLFWVGVVGGVGDIFCCTPL